MKIPLNHILMISFLRSFRNLKLVYLTISFGVVSSLVYSQPFESEEAPNPLSIENEVSAPLSPEAAAFTKYGNTDVSLYTGRPNINIPIASLQGRKFSLPVSLDYNASGVKVQDLATWVGLGWNLNAGGAVTRQVISKPDHFISTEPIYPHYTSFYDIMTDYKFMKDNYFHFGGAYNAADLAKYENFMFHYNRGEYELEPDVYSFNVNGFSGTIFIDYYTSVRAYCVENPEIKITPIMGVDGPTGWVITNSDGVIYEFKKAEITSETIPGGARDGIEDAVRSYYSSWLLTKITSADESDIVKFHYSDAINWQQPQYMHSNESFKDYGGGTFTECGRDQEAPTTAVPSTYNIRQFELLSVTINDETFLEIVRDTSSESRKDLLGRSKLDQIKVFNGEGDLINIFDLQHSYFGDEERDPENKLRLRLDEVRQLGVSSNSANGESKSYYFDYHNPGSLPSRDSKAQDYWGYYNGKTGNSTLIPYDYYFDKDNETFQGAERRPSLSHASMGTLKSITYPTGGSSHFTYELNRVGNNGGSGSAGSGGDQSLIERRITTLTSGYVVGGTDNDDPFDYQSCLYDGFDINAKPKGAELNFTVVETGDVNILLNTQGQVQYDNEYFQFAAIYRTGYSDDYTPGVLSAVHSLPEMSVCDLINQPTAAVFYIHANLGENTAINQEIELEHGFYKLIMLNTNDLVTLSMQVKGVELIGWNSGGSGGSGSNGGIDVGGLRIKSITDKAANAASPDVVKSYIYRDLSDDSDYSDSGLLHKPLNFKKSVLTTVFDQTNNAISCESVIRYPHNTSKSTSEITYSAVTERITSGSVNQGYTVYHFYNKKDFYHNPFDVTTINNGKLKSKIYYNSAGQWVYKENNNYSEGVLEVTPAFTLRHVSSDLTQDTYKVRYDGSSLVGYLSRSKGGIVIDGDYTRSSCTWGGDSPEIEKISCSADVIKTDQLVYSFPRWWSKLESSSVSRKEGGIVIEEETNYLYENLDHYQPTQILVRDSKDIEHKKELRYPHDLGNTALIASNRIKEVLEQRSYVNNTFNYLKKREFNGQLLSRVSVEDADGLLLNDLNYYQYRGSRPSEVGRTDGSRDVFLYGNNGKSIIGIIKNTTVDEVNAAIAASDSESYTPDLDEDGQVDLMKYLRDELPNAQVTSFTHKHMVGVLTMTDPNGQVTHYSYDYFNRLEQVKDNENKILQQVEYNYANPGN